MGEEIFNRPIDFMSKGGTIDARDELGESGDVDIGEIEPPLLCTQTKEGDEGVDNVDDGVDWPMEERGKEGMTGWIRVNPCVPIRAGEVVRDVDRELTHEEACGVAPRGPRKDEGPRRGDDGNDDDIGAEMSPLIPIAKRQI